MRENFHLVDFHLHSNYSDDSKQSPRQIIIQAKKRGIRYLAITDHYCLNPADSGYPPKIDFNEYRHEIECLAEEFSKDINIYCGLEFGEPHACQDGFSKIDGDDRFDFIIGSLHFVLDMDVSVVFDRSRFALDELYEQYFSELLGLAQFGKFDALGHFDVIKRHEREPYNPAQFEELIREILKAAIETETAIEVNSSGLRFTCNELIPAGKILSWYRELGGELVTVGSDGHWPQHVGFGISEAMKAVRKVGFPGITIFEKRRPRILTWEELVRK